MTMRTGSKSSMRPKEEKRTHHEPQALQLCINAEPRPCVICFPAVSPIGMIAFRRASRMNGIPPRTGSRQILRVAGSKEDASLATQPQNALKHSDTYRAAWKLAWSKGGICDIFYKTTHIVTPEVLWLEVGFLNETREKCFGKHTQTLRLRSFHYDYTRKCSSSALSSLRRRHFQAI